MNERLPRATLDDVYGDAAPFHDSLESLLDESLSPRGSDMMFDLAIDLGAGPNVGVLDVGSADGRRTADLVQRSRCSAVGVEIVQANLDRRHDVLAGLDHDVAARMRFVRGDVQRLPFGDAAFDAVWSRDMLIHVPDLQQAFAECRRVARPGGWMLVFQMFETPWLSDDDAARLFGSIAAFRRNTDPTFFEWAAREAGWTIQRVEHITSEWREFDEESGSRRTSQQLLRAARMLREPDRYVEAMGRASYEAEVADSLWGVYQMIGKLAGRVYVLR